MNRAKLISPTQILLERPIYGSVDDPEFVVESMASYKRTRNDWIKFGVLIGFGAGAILCLLFHMLLTRPVKAQALQTVGPTEIISEKNSRGMTMGWKFVRWRQDRVGGERTLEVSTDGIDWVAFEGQTPPGRTYHPIGIPQFAAADPKHWPAGLHTHAIVNGFVTYTNRENDGDFHVRVCDRPNLAGMNRTECIVAEFFPGWSDALPGKGQHVTVKGITRYDAEAAHNWWEIHPVEHWELVVGAPSPPRVKK